MQADKSCKPDRNFLQELLDAPAKIRQADLEELQRLEDRVRQARPEYNAKLQELEEILRLAEVDYEATGAQIVEMLAFGWPVEKGILSVRSEGSRLVLSSNLSEETDTPF